MCRDYSTITDCASPGPDRRMEGAIAGKRQTYDGTSGDVATYKQTLGLAVEGLAVGFKSSFVNKTFTLIHAPSSS